jgi:hypothetical protein
VNAEHGEKPCLVRGTGGEPSAVQMNQKFCALFFKKSATSLLHTRRERLRRDAPDAWAARKQLLFLEKKVTKKTSVSRGC